MKNRILESRILGNIDANEIIIGKGVIVEKGVVISGKNGPAERVVLGDFSYIGENSKIFVPEFRLGDYSKLHANAYCHGEKPLRIGRNCWLGGHVILDSLGGLDIDDNVGIGAQSQIWTHIRFGDIIQGSRFNSKKYMHIKKDAWFVGHCIVSPVRVEEKSMAMVGSVITKDMECNNIYAGVPAKNITDKTGGQFEELNIDEKQRRFEDVILKFEQKYPEHSGLIKSITDNEQEEDSNIWFNLQSRKYNKKYRLAEVLFLKENTPLIKFTANNEDSFIFD